MATVKIDKSNFQSDVLQAKEPVVVDFRAEWCGPQDDPPALEEISAGWRQGQDRQGQCRREPSARLRRALDSDAGDVQGWPVADQSVGAK